MCSSWKFLRYLFFRYLFLMHRIDSIRVSGCSWGSRRPLPVVVSKWRYAIRSLQSLTPFYLGDESSMSLR